MSQQTSAITCKRCGKAVTGRYMQALEADWHPNCFVCEGCGKILNEQFVLEAGRAYHPRCHEERFGLRCTLCSELIQGSYFWHDGQPVCERDYMAKLAPRCAVCAAALTTSFVRNEWGQTVCARHQDAPQCSSCGRWLVLRECMQGTLATFGTKLCTHCRSGAVTGPDLKTYGNSFGIAALAELGLRLSEIPPVPIRLDTASRIQKLHGMNAGAVEGVTLTNVWTRDGVETGREVQEILVQGGLAREHFEGTLAHEFGHVWLFHEKIDYPRGSPVSEGFCELVRLFWLRKLGTALAQCQARNRLASTDPVYGEGLRRFLDLADAGGTRAVLDALRKR